MKGRRYGVGPIERELAAIPDRALRICQNILFENSVKMLSEEKETADPDWLEARVENMLLTNGTALARMRKLGSEAEMLLERYRQLPNADPRTLSGFEISALLAVKQQISRLEENEFRFRQLLRVIRDAKKQRTAISLSRLMNQIAYGSVQETSAPRETQNNH